MQNYDIYKQARDMAWKFLIENNVTELPIDLLEVCKKNGYHLLLDSKHKYLEEHDRGISFLRDGQWYIEVNSSDNILIRRYTFAHEIGHIYLNHLLCNGRYGRTFGVQGVPKTTQEYQAERFAIDILAPACVLWGLDLHTAKDISEACNISMTAAQRRAERMAVLYQRNRFLTSPLEKQVFQQFKPFIKSKRSL